MKYGIGQKVKVKDFSELVKEFGVESNGNIIIGNYYFVRQMKVYCGEEYRIKNTYADGTYELDLQDGEEWFFSEEMLEEINKVDVIKKYEEHLKTAKIEVVEPDKHKRTYTRRK